MKSIFTILFLGIAAVISAQQMGEQTLAQLQETQAGSNILGFFDAVESGSLSKESIDQYFSPKLLERIGEDRLKAAFNDILENDGALTMYRANRVKLTEYTLEAKGIKSRGWVEMKFYFEDNEPYRITGFTTDSVRPGDDSVKPIYPKTN